MLSLELGNEKKKQKQLKKNRSRTWHILWIAKKLRKKS